MSDTRRELYVYYRVAAAHWHEAADAVARWQREMCLTHPGLVARVLRRPEADDAVVMLMEVYAGLRAIDAVVEATLVRGASALEPWLLDQRHIERFEALD